MSIMPMDGGGGGCTKCIIDNGMGISAGRFYGRALKVLVRFNSFRPVDYEVGDFYADVLADCEKVAQAVWPRLNKDQRAALLKQVDQACYRADYLVNWTTSLSAKTTEEQVAAWTATVLNWIKDDQAFYIALAKGEELP